MSALYVVATPIGNLEDITLRALRVLKEVDLIAAEDTRTTKKLLSRYGISTPLTSYHAHNEKGKALYLIEKLKQGKSIALVTDAGTPAISDPGYRLVGLSIENSIDVIPIPGVSAVITALSISGLPTDEFTFKGFIPSKKSARKRFLEELKARPATYVVYESPKRILDTLSDIKEIIGDSRIVISREATKLHEETLRGRTADVAELLKGREIKGEITVVLLVEERKEVKGDVKEELKKLFKMGLSLKDAVRVVSSALDMSKSFVYKEAIKLKEG